MVYIMRNSMGFNWIKKEGKVEGKKIRSNI